MGIHTQPINNSKYGFVQKWDVPNIPNIPGEFPKFERFAPEFALPYIFQLAGAFIIRKPWEIN